MEAEIHARREDILILESDADVLARTTGYISENFPDAKITAVDNLDECREIVTSRDFDIVIVDYDLGGVSRSGIIHQLKIKDYEPAILLLSASTDPAVVNEISRLGCQRYLHRYGNWIPQLGLAVRQMLRVRRLEEENHRLIAQLTEAKMFLEEKNKRLDEFSATVAHDIRGPLGGLAMKLEYIIDKYSGQLDPKLAGMLQKAFGTTDRLVSVVQEMYNYARLGSQAARMAKVDLHKLVEDVVSDMSFDEKLDIKVGIGDLPQVWGNQELLRRVFINLIGNAVKYNDKPEIIINVGCSGITSKNLGVFAGIYVEDNGPGISEKDQENVFAIFKRGSAGSVKDDGLGVGLSVVRRIAELHFGGVELESGASGARFTLSLPVDKIEFFHSQ